MNEIEQLKAELKQTKLAYQMAAQISQFKTGFLSRTAHELRSPLSSLMGLHQLILADLCESPEEERQFLTQAHEAANKLIRIIDDIIKVSKIDYKTIPVRLEFVSLNTIFSEIKKLTYLQAASRNIKLEILSLEPEIYVEIDFHRFLQGLLMLIDAAIDKMRNGKITVLAFSKDEANLAIINVDIQGAESILQEKKDLLENIPNPTLESIKKFSEELEMSPGMKFLLAQSLLESVGGNLEILEVSPHEQKESLIRLQYSLPLASAEALAQDL